MATTNPHTIVDRVDQCRRVVRELCQDDVISADAEGVHLSNTGPLTLLQVGRADGHVYLFDILTGGPEMFTEGQLKDLLESDTIVKVMHGSSNDSGALKTQFGVELSNVFDTQIGHLTREESKGRRLPSKQKLCEVCDLYMGDASMLDGKDDIQAKWNKKEGEYWAKRPMIPEMVDYACADIRLLIPVYQHQKRMLEATGLWDQFLNNMEEDLKYRWDEKVRDSKNAKHEALVEKILLGMDGKYNSESRYEEINDEDEIQALKRTRIQNIEKYSPTIQNLKCQVLKADVTDIQRELDSQGRDFYPQNYKVNVLFAAREHPDEDVRSTAKELLSRCNDIIKHDIGIKYTLETPLNHVTKDEQRVLRSLKPKSDSDQKYNKVVLRLYWLQMEADLDFKVQKFSEHPSDYSIKDGDVGKIKFYASNDGVPDGIKTKARDFLHRLQDSGKVVHSAKGRGRKGRR